MTAVPQRTPALELDADELAALERLPAPAVVEHALARHGLDLAISFSGAEDVLLIEYARRTGRDFRVFTLDTGRLHAETHAFIETVEQHYGIRVQIRVPEREPLERLIADKGLFSFFRDGHTECCGIRKVEPLARQLAGAQAWMTGQRRDQNPLTRAAVPVAEIDARFVGRGAKPLRKYNPLWNYTSAQVWDEIRAHGVPFNPLHTQGFVSIGCEPCTRPIGPGQHEREGRWWWEHEDKKECGLHLPLVDDGRGEG